MWPHGFTWFNFGAALLGLTGFGAWYASLTPSYTISYELLYYLVWGLVWAVFRRKPASALLAAFVIWLIAYIILPNSLFRYATMLFIVWWMGAGVWLFREMLFPAMRKVPEGIGWLILICASVGLAVSLNAMSPVLTTGAPDLGAFIRYSILGLAFAILILTYVSKTDGGENARFDRFLGEMSYPLFVTQGPVLVFTAYLINASGMALTFSTHLVVLCVVALVVSYLFVLLVERPVMAWRRTIGTKAPATNIPAPAAARPLTRP
jgi:peptidoglycan/LPS O-acetylase OafA/YrhL